MFFDLRNLPELSWERSGCLFNIFYFFVFPVGYRLECIRHVYVVFFPLIFLHGTVKAVFYQTSRMSLRNNRCANMLLMFFELETYFWDSTPWFLVGVFEANARLLQLLVFVISSTRSVNFFVHLFNNINLNYERPKHTRNARTSFKTKTSTSRTSKTKDPPLAFLLGFFSALCDIFEVFWIPPKGLPFVFFDILQHNGCQKIPKCPPFTFFGTVTLFKNLILKIFRIFFKISQGSPLFSSYFATNRIFTKPKGSPFYNFEP